MRSINRLTYSIWLAMFVAGLNVAGPVMSAEVQLRRSAPATPFRYEDLPTPVVNDLGRDATVTVVSGRVDRNSGGLSCLNDGQLPGSEDEPAENFFFQAGSSGGRLRFDLQRDCDLAAIRTYSWHPGVRGPQVYELYGLASGRQDATLSPAETVDPVAAGWSLLAKVDTREEREAGQPSDATVAVSVTGTNDELKGIRYLLFVVHATDAKDPFAQTFLSEIDVLERGAPPAEPIPLESSAVYRFATADDKFQFEMDLKGADDLSQWSREVLAPVVIQWYPKIVAQLPSEDYSAPRLVRLRYRTDMNGTPAYAQGNTISLNLQWYRTQLEGEARGATVHELVHVAQQYGRRDLQRGLARSTPGWIVEGIADYIRWFQYEPESQGAVIRGARIDSVKHNDSYRVTGNFIDWVVREKDAELLRHLNAAARTGQYDQSLWKTRTGSTLEELEAQWKANLRTGGQDKP